MSTSRAATTSWEVGSVDQEPDKTLDAWSVYEVPFDGPGMPPTRHLAGFVRETCRGRVSMPIVRFDPERRRALTRSGRVYHLAGRPGLNSDALYVWGLWKRTNRVSDGRDVTQDVSDELSRAGGPSGD